MKRPKRLPNFRELWPDTLQIIRRVRTDQDNTAPVDMQGCHTVADRTVDTQTFQYQTLLGLMLSAQTKDSATSAAMTRLRDKNLTPEFILGVDLEELEQLIYPVSFYRTKAKNIKRVTEILRDNYDYQIPDNLKEIIKLPGVGPKMALLWLQICLDKVSGISVDTHVHRVANRLGWASSKTPEQTRLQLEKLIAEEWWGEINWALVGYGQTICKPINPQCQMCEIKEMCKFYSENPSKATKKKKK